MSTQKGCDFSGVCDYYGCDYLETIQYYIFDCEYLRVIKFRDNPGRRIRLRYLEHFELGHHRIVIRCPARIVLTSFNFLYDINFHLFQKK